MPFAVFRRHQRKLLALFAILAMFGFVVADSLPRLLSGGYAPGKNPVVVDLYGRSVYRSDLSVMLEQRRYANLFMAEITGLLVRRPTPEFFGDLSTKSLVDALILQHEADRLGMPTGPDVAKEWLRNVFGSTVMTKELFELVLSRFNKTVSGEQVLNDIGNQVRLRNVRFMLGNPTITPLDVFQTYRDQNERVSVRAVEFRVEDYLTKVGEPSDSEVQAFYDKYKEELPDPVRPTPGFKIPRQIVVEILSLDGEALARSLKDKLTDAEITAYYDNRKSEFKRRSEFPDEIFAGAPELTPPLYQSLSEVRPYLATSLSEERAQTEIINKFGRVKDDVLIPFADRYLEAADEVAEATKQGRASSVELPKPDNLRTMADKEGLSHEITPKLTRDRAEHYGVISSAEVGLNKFSGGRKFAEELFETKSALFEPIEMTDPSGIRFLIRKIEDNPPRIPELDEIRAQVVTAWKTEKARPLAAKAARELADKIKGEKGKIEGDIIDGRPVITTDPVTRMQPGLPLPGQFFVNGPATLSDIAQMPMLSDALRDAYFGLQEGQVSVASNAPESIYYVMTLNQRFRATFDALYAVNGDYFRYQEETMREAFRKLQDEWMNDLRAQAGLKPDWTPPDENKTDEESNG